jgi:hypothetical protein
MHSLLNSIHKIDIKSQFHLKVFDSDDDVPLCKVFNFVLTLFLALFKVAFLIDKVQKSKR